MVKNYNSIQKYYINDLVNMSSFLDEILLSYTPLWGDMESLNYPKNIDLIISSSTIQWFNHITTFFENSYNSLNKEGILAISTFSKNNFIEINNILSIGLYYFSLNNLLQIAKEKGFKLLLGYNTYKKIFFSSPMQVLKHIRNTGVNALDNSIWNRKKIAFFEKEYLQYKTKEGFPLTYHPTILIFKK